MNKGICLRNRFEQMNFHTLVSLFRFNGLVSNKSIELHKFVDFIQLNRILARRCKICKLIEILVIGIRWYQNAQYSSNEIEILLSQHLDEPMANSFALNVQLHVICTKLNCAVGGFMTVACMQLSALIIANVIQMCHSRVMHLEHSLPQQNQAHLYDTILVNQIK